MNQYYTHQDYLRRTLDCLDFNKPTRCLEFGSGDGSSIIFNEYAKKYNNMSIDCFEHDNIWLKTMKSKYETQNYNFNVVDWSSFDYSELKKGVYDLIFVDQGDWEARITTIDELRHCSKYIILHDYCYYNGFRGFSIPEAEKESALSIKEGTFFHKKYSDDFEIVSEVTLFPPTLILKKK